MELFLIINLIIQSIVFLVVFFFIYKKDDDDKLQTGVIMQSYSDMLKGTVETFIQELGKIEKSHFDNLEKTSTKQLQILERQTKDYMKGISDLAQAMKPNSPTFTPDLLDKLPKAENTIDREDIPDQNLGDMPPIPITDGVNIQFEGQEEIIPFIPS